MQRLGKMGPRTKSQDSGWSSYGWSSWSSQDQWHHYWHNRPNDDSSRSVTADAGGTGKNAGTGMTGHSSSQDGPSDDAYSGDSPASDDEASANGCHLRGDGNFTRLEAYVADLPRDTFTSWPHSSWCNVQQRSENEYQAAIRLPPACAVRNSFRSSWCNSEVEAKDRAAQKALEFLRQRLDGPFQPMEIDEKVRWPFTPPSDGGPKVLRPRPAMAAPRCFAPAT